MQPHNQDQRVSQGTWALFLIVLTMPFWNIGHPLWEVDDARYAEVPREMAEIKDWMTPHLNYVDYLQKPPLIYWLDAASYSVFGVSETASRIPLALLTVLGILGTAWLGSWLFSPNIGIYAGIILGTSVEFSILGHLQTPDTAVTVFLLWSCAFILRALRRPEDAWWAGPAAGISAALAFLAKGLIAFVFPTLWAIALAALWPDLRRGFKSLLISGAIPICLVIVGAWTWTMSSHHPRFFFHFFIEQHFIRFLTPHYNRPGPWYYFIGVDLVGMLPWTLLALAAMALPLAHWRETNPKILQLLVWIGLVFAFFTASKSKLPTYILPLMPQESLLAAELLHRLDSEKNLSQWVKAWSMRLGIFFWICIPSALLLWRWLPMPGMITNNVILTGTIVLLALGGGIISLASPMSSHGLKALRRTAYMAMAVTALLLAGAQQLQAYLSARDISNAIRSQYHPGDQIISYGIYLHGVPFYTRRPVNKVVNWIGEFDYAKQDARFQRIFEDDNAIRRLPEPGHAAFVVLHKRDVAYFVSLTQTQKVRQMEHFGDWVLAVF